MKPSPIKGVVPALTTPFFDDQKLNLDAFAKLTEIVIGDGVDALLVNGCTGESWALSPDERFQIFKSSVETAKGRVPVIAGCSDITAAGVIAKIRQAEKAGCAVAMVSAPWYVLLSEDEIMHHFETVLAASELPVLLYNIPRRVGVHLTPNMVDRLADHPKVIAIKESSKDWGVLSTIIRRCKDRIGVFAGYCSYFGLAALTEGAIGYMDSGTPVFGKASVDFYKAATTGDLETARRIQTEMATMLEAYFGLGTFPAAIKASLDLLGRPGGRTRDPIRPLNDAQRRKLAAAMEAAGFLEKTKLRLTA